MRWDIRIEIDRLKPLWVQRIMERPRPLPKTGNRLDRSAVIELASDGLVTCIRQPKRRTLVIIGESEFGEPPPGREGHKMPWLVHYNAGAARGVQRALSTQTASDAETTAEREAYKPDCSDLERARDVYMRGWSKEFWGW